MHLPARCWGTGRGAKAGRAGASGVSPQYLTAYAAQKSGILGPSALAHCSSWRSLWPLAVASRCACASPVARRGQGSRCLTQCGKLPSKQKTPAAGTHLHHVVREERGEVAHPEAPAPGSLLRTHDHTYWHDKDAHAGVARYALESVKPGGSLSFLLSFFFADTDLCGTKIIRHIDGGDHAHEQQNRRRDTHYLNLLRTIGHNYPWLNEWLAAAQLRFKSERRRSPYTAGVQEI